MVLVRRPAPFEGGHRLTLVVLSILGIGVQTSAGNPVVHVVIVLDGGWILHGC